MEIKELIIDTKQILSLYEDNNWTQYTENPGSLIEGIGNSLFKLGAYDGDRLVGLIRVVGDKKTIIYIQDILILIDYQNQGIGTDLLRAVLERFADVRQIVLTTDNTETQKKFYESNGFIRYEDMGLVGYYKKD